MVEYDGSLFNGFQRQMATSAYQGETRNNDYDNSDNQPTTTATNCSRNHISTKKRKRSAKDSSKNKVRTVQGCLEDALVKWMSTTFKDCNITIPELRLRCAGRTDKGVHATGQIVAFDLPKQQEEEEEEESSKKSLDGCGYGSSWQLQRAINSRLPSDIAIRHVSSCSSTFEPRQCVKQKTYTYRLRYRRKVWMNTSTTIKKEENPNNIDTKHISNKNQNKEEEQQQQQQHSEQQQLHPLCDGGGPQTLRSPHDPSCLWICPWSLDDRNLDSICNELQGTHDYSCFVHKSDRSKKDNTIYLQNFHVEYIQQQQQETLSYAEEDNKINSGTPPPAIVDVQFIVQANGFRRSMVRNLVGFVVDIMRGQVSQQDIPKVLLLKKSSPSTEGKDDGKSNDEDVAMMSKLVHSAPASGLCLSKVTY